MRDDIWQRAGRSIGGVTRGRALLPQLVDEFLQTHDRIVRRSTQRSRLRRPGEPLPPAALRRNGRHIAELSEQMEAARPHPGEISSGRGDPGGVSYGLPQLASNERQPQAFLQGEGRRWLAQFRSLQPATPEFDRTWRAIAAREPEAFGDAQRAFIARVRYNPTVEATLDNTGLDLDARADAVRESAWSTAVNHGQARRLFAEAIRETDRRFDRESPDYDAALIKNIYGSRIRYVKGLSGDTENYSERERRTFRNMVRNRFAEEPRRAIALLPSRR